MGKRSGDCDRPGITMKASGAKINVEHLNEITTTLELQRIEGRWLTKDDLVIFQGRKKGWVAFSFSDPIWKAFAEYGLIDQQDGTSSYELTYFPSLKAARKAVNDVSLEAGLSIDSRLTRGKLLSYKIGDLPMRIGKINSHWHVYELQSALPQSLQTHFNSTEEFLAAWYTTGPVATQYPTRKSALQAAIDWLAHTITEGK